MTSLSHPYKDHSESWQWPEERCNEIEELYEWIQKQPRFPKMSRNHAHQFYHACLYDMENTKNAFQRYVELRAASPDCFGVRDPMLPAMQNIYTAAQMIALPKLTTEGYRILSYRLKDFDPSKMVFGEAVKAFNMFNDVVISVDGPLNGYVVVFDMKGVCLRHLTRVQFGPLRNFMAYIQEGHPVRLKKIYVCHTASFINQCMALVKPLIKTDLMSLLKFTNGSPAEFFPLSHLPSDYGGELESFETYHEEQRKRLETEYRDWLIDSSHLKQNPKEKKADKKSQLLDANDNPITSLSALEID